MKDQRPEEVRPSQVFLELWQMVTTLDCELPAEDFARYAQAWRQIVSLEEIYAEAERLRPRAPSGRRAVEGDGPYIGTEGEKDPSSAAQDDGGPAGAPAPTSPTEGGGTPHPPAAPAPSPQGEGLTYDCASAPMPDPEEVTHANRSVGAKAGFATRKRNLTERLEGHKLHEIAEAVPGLTINDVMDGLNAKTITPMKIQALEKACRKLEEAQAGG